MNSQFLSLFGAGDSWFDADLYTVDGGTSKVSEWIDRLDATHKLIQASGSLQCAVPAASALMQGAKVALFPSSFGPRYVSNRTAAQWAWLHQPGATAITVFTPRDGTSRSSALWGTTTYGSPTAKAGVCAYTLGTGVDIYACQVQAKNATPVSDWVSGAVAKDVPTFFRYQYGGSTVTWARKGTVSQSSAQSVASISDAPVTTLNLGNDGGGGAQSMFADWRASYFWKRALSAGDLAVAHAYITSNTGIAP